MSDTLGHAAGETIARTTAGGRAATLSRDTAPASFADFRPVGSVMIGLPDLASAAALVRDLRQAGWSREALQHFDPEASVAQLGARIQASGPLAGLGFEIVLLRRYLELAGDGREWLLVRVDDHEHAAAAATLARNNGATLAVHHRALAVDELL